MLQKKKKNKTLLSWNLHTKTGNSLTRKAFTDIKWLKTNITDTKNQKTKAKKLTLPTATQQLPKFHCSSIVCLTMKRSDKFVTKFKLGEKPTLKYQTFPYSFLTLLITCRAERTSQLFISLHEPRSSSFLFIVSILNILNTAA